MTDLERLNLLKAALAVAAADGVLRRSEMGVIEGLAARVGVGRASLDAMIAAAERGDLSDHHMLIKSETHARTALELLVAEARLDGEIADREREFLVAIGLRLKITGDEFQSVYQAGIARADKIRQGRRAP